MVIVNKRKDVNGLLYDFCPNVTTISQQPESTYKHIEEPFDNVFFHSVQCQMERRTMKKFIER